LRAASSVKAFGAEFTFTHKGTVAASWDGFIGSIERILHVWQARNLPFLRQNAQALEVYAMSKA
jgi:hypothetical protein